ncbi:hypothetical protein N656DRAFT_305329 [Canariomyces notabilis]|uniref:Uncharacterized protein n=1 Tax=Canariomyces notabilis TaxID=2074819 RepID=A0AAN6QGT4_9PEZI|nr:hypothetical protein N656DRAFT_305329 [Canariomyces arenarius]
MNCQLLDCQLFFLSPTKTYTVPTTSNRSHNRRSTTFTQSCVEMSTQEEAPADNRDALEVLEAEAKEWDKVRLLNRSPSTTTVC